MKGNQKIYITGHRNPDTDSICSAIAYAYLKNQCDAEKGKGKFVPKRAGHINEETEFVLKRFGIDRPGFMPNVAAQIRDIDIHELKGVRGDITIKQAWEIMDRENIYTLPITSENSELLGLITVNDIARSYMDIHDSSTLSRAGATYGAIAETLAGEVIVGDPDKFFNEGRVTVGSFHPDKMGTFIKPKDLVIMGNRAEDQLFAFEKEVSCIVVGLGAEINKMIQKLAADVDCVLISSPYDTYTIARLINQAIPIRFLMKSKDLLIFSPSDTVDSAREIMRNSRHRDYPIVDKKGKFLGTISRRNLINSRKKQVILVDHNEVDQAPENINEAEILEILDHHRLGSLETIQPVLFRNQPVGCTATIIYQIFGERNIEIPPNIAGILFASIISDTLIFRSPTCTDVDKAAAADLAKIAGIKDINAFAAEMFHAGSNLKSKSGQEIFYQDFKKFSLDDLALGIGQINLMDSTGLEDIRDEIMETMAEEADKKGIDMAFFMLTNILKESTELLFYGKNVKELVEEAFQVEVTEPGRVTLQDVVSRKKQLVPSLMAAFQQK